MLENTDTFLKMKIYIHKPEVIEGTYRKGRFSVREKQLHSKV